MRRVVLAFGHKRRRGKGESAQCATAHLHKIGASVQEMSFAAPLKMGIGRDILGFSDQQMYGEAKMEIDPFWGFTPRWAFQKGGEAFRKMLHPDVWARALERAALNTEDSIVVDDLRYPNEVEAVRRLGGVCVRVDRPDHLLPKATNAEEDAHESEHALDDFDDWDWIIANDGSIEALHDKVVGVLIEMGMGSVFSRGVNVFKEILKP